MKTSEFRKLIREEVRKIVKESSFKEADLDELIPVAEKAFATVYPNELYFDNDGSYLYISTDKEDPGAASMWGEGSRKHYYLSINLYEEDGTLNLVVNNATANKFKGATTPILKAMFDYGTTKLGPIKNKVLYIEDDRSDGTWKQIAKQLKVKYESSDD
jgi:hypothetical protein